MPNSSFDDFLLQFYHFTTQQLHLIRSQATERTYPPSAFFSEAVQ